MHHNNTETHCSNGHEVNAANTRIDSRGYSKCRICDRDYRRKKREHIDPEKGVIGFGKRRFVTTYCPDNAYRIGSRFGRNEIRAGIALKTPENSCFPVGMQFSYYDSYYEVRQYDGKLSLEVVR